MTSGLSAFMETSSVSNAVTAFGRSQRANVVHADRNGGRKAWQRVLAKSIRGEGFTVHQRLHVAMGVPTTGPNSGAQVLARRPEPVFVRGGPRRHATCR